MVTEEASARAKRSRTKGAVFEAALARYLRQWWPNAVRAIRTGSSAAADPGDISGVGGVILSAKDAAEERFDRWWPELEAMLAADPAALGVIVHKRRGSSDPGRAWAHLYLGDLVSLVASMGPVTGSRDRTPVRIALADLVELLVASGYTRGPR